MNSYLLPPTKSRVIFINKENYLISMIEPILSEIGLTNSEIKVYLALLETGEAKTGKILKQSGLNSGKIYEILNSLQKKGLVSFVSREGIKYFKGAAPEMILSYLEEKKKTLVKQEKQCMQILPELIAKANESKNESSIEIYTGLKGMKSAYGIELQFPKEKLCVWGIAASKTYHKSVSRFFAFHQKKRVENKLDIYKLMSEESRKNRNLHEKTAHIKYLPYASSVGISIISDISIIGIFEQEYIFIVIKSKKVADGMREQFDFLWKIAKV
jgi:sugar-specific transcriptional regulator TrmB